MLQELLDGYLIFLVAYSLYKIIDAGIYQLKERPKLKRNREQYLREMGRLKD
ncbi:MULTISPECIES: hypothetical protein [Bacillus]|uniref:hypothetical protein n=1 Tax=Bacillus TaxID=1386 RepID=UPI000A3021A0|nr:MULTISPECIES: hypothetical protein [Bacillus cereus group]SME49278.1 hypothetical protein BACERE00183_04257 [Bacillus cereus]